MDATDRLPHVVIGRGGHGAGVQHHQAGFGARSRGIQAFCRQHGVERGAGRLCGPAAEILNEKLVHFFYGTNSQRVRSTLLRKNDAAGACWALYTTSGTFASVSPPWLRYSAGSGLLSLSSVPKTVL